MATANKKSKSTSDSQDTTVVQPTVAIDQPQVSNINQPQLFNIDDDDRNSMIKKVFCRNITKRFLSYDKINSFLDVTQKFTPFDTLKMYQDSVIPIHLAWAVRKLTQNPNYIPTFFSFVKSNNKKILLSYIQQQDLLRDVLKIKDLGLVFKNWDNFPSYLVDDSIVALIIDHANSPNNKKFKRVILHKIPMAYMSKHQDVFDYLAQSRFNRFTSSLSNSCSSVKKNFISSNAKLT